jgi:hypothetical protein
VPAGIARGGYVAGPESRRVPVNLEYWLAGKFGLVWLRLHASLRLGLGELPAECVLLAGGQPLPAGRLCRAQGFAARVWWRAGLVAALLIFPVIGATAALGAGRAATDVAVSLIFGLGCLAGVAMLQMALLSFRSSQIRLYLRTAGPTGRGRAAAGGLPRTAQAVGFLSHADNRRGRFRDPAVCRHAHRSRKLTRRALPSVASHIAIFGRAPAGIKWPRVTAT